MWNEIRDLVPQIKVESTGKSCPVQVTAQPNNLRCVGLGTTAAVFQLKNWPEIAVKKFLSDQTTTCQEEGEIYRQLGSSPHYPAFYGMGDDFLVISYRPGRNVFDYLLRGIFIPEQIILDVEEGLKYARNKGLNPSDIHLKNIIIHQDRGYLVDVSSYRRPGECKRWNSLRHAYYNYYLELYHPGLAVPSWMLDAICAWYKATESDLDISSFADKMRKIFF